MANSLQPLGASSFVCEARTRAAAVATVLSYAGLAYADAATRDAYVALLFPHDPPAVARQMAAKMSSCALTAMALLRAIGCSAPGLDEPYGKHVGKAVAIVEGLALRQVRDATGLHTAWRDASGHIDPDAPLPAPGDIVVIGRETGGSAWGRGPLSAFTHVLTVVEVSDGGAVLHSVDGGQPGIAERTRDIVYVAGELWLGAMGQGKSSDGRPVKGRRVDGWLDLSKLDLDREPSLPPEAEAAIAALGQG